MTLLMQCKKIIAKNKKTVLAFLSVGFFTAVLYFSLFSVLWKILGINYSIAVSIAYLISILFYFFVNRRYTFKSHSHSMRNQFIKFIGMVIINYITTIIIVRSSVEIFSVPPYVGMVLAIGLNTLLSYILAKFWVFQITKQGEI